MTQITGITLPEDGQTATTTPYNNAITKILDVVNGKLGDDNITANALTAASLAPSADPSSLIQDIVTDFVVSGCEWSQSAGLTGTMTSGEVMINGATYSVTSVASKIFTASQDTYIDVGSDDTIDYTAVSVGAAPPAVAADHVRLARVRTDGSNIIEVSKVRLGGVVRDKLATDAKTPRSSITTSVGSITPNLDDYSLYGVTAQAAALTINNPVGYLSAGQGLVIRIKDDGTSRSITWGADFRGIGVTAPTATTISKTVYVGAIYNATDDKWDILAVAEEA